MVKQSSLSYWLFYWYCYYYLGNHNFMALAEDTGSDEQVSFQDDFVYGASNWTVTSGVGLL